jgi:3-hydroxyacyl-CoA dehydrogenase
VSQPVSYRVDADIAVISTNNPPVNALGQAVRSGLLASIEQALADDAVKAIVIGCEGRTFFAGADIREFGKPPQAPSLPEVLNAIEASSKPVIAAMHGTALGGGLETALACHYRVALTGSKVGLPEVNLGLIPGAGGTVRLPRLIGVERALAIMTSGRPVNAAEAHADGILDAVVDGSDAIAAGCDFAREAIDTGLPVRPVRDIDDGLAAARADASVIEQQRDLVRSRARGALAPLACVDAVAAAVEQPFDDAMVEARRLFTDLVAGDQSKALRHVFMAERAVSKVPGASGEPSLDVKSVGVIGGGTMGAGISVAMLNAGLSVHMIERDDESAERGRAGVDRILQSSVKRGRLSAEAKDELLAARYSVGTDYADLASCDLVIEAVFEDMAVKQAVFRELDSVCRADAILATNTSYLDINEIAATTSRPGQVIGLHFFSPAHVMKLLEIVVADATDANVVASCFALGKKIGKVCVRAGVCDGFIGNRILARYKLCADYIMIDGASPYDIDAALLEFGYPMGVFAVGDLAGLDIGWATRKRRAPTRDPRERYITVADQVCEHGWYGQKTGKGFYVHDGARPQPNPEVINILNAERERLGIEPQNFSNQQIIDRYLAAMINEAANVVQEGIALRPLDVDITAIYGYGFPRWRGGPMQYADTIGLDRVLADIRRFAEQDDFFWQPAELLVELAGKGQNFASLNS